MVKQKIADSFAWFASNGICQEKKCCLVSAFSFFVIKRKCTKANFNYFIESLDKKSVSCEKANYTIVLLDTVKQLSPYLSSNVITKSFLINFILVSLN